MDPIKYERPEKCRMELGIVGGTAVSHVSGNMIDLENDLRGANRPVSSCPMYDHLPGNGQVIQRHEQYKPVIHEPIDTTMKHLPSCQMISYGSVPNIPFPNNYSCNNKS
jgi:hypothetical protein